MSPDVALPCSQAGGFRCVSCSYRTLLSSAQQAYDHVRVCLAKVQPALACPSLGQWNTSLKWLQAELVSAGLDWFAYDQKLPTGMTGYPALPGARVDGYMCELCRSPFCYENSGVKHCNTQHAPPAKLVQRKLQRLGEKSTIVLEQVSSMSEDRLHDFSRFDVAFAGALAPPAEATARPFAPAASCLSGPLVALPFEATYGTSQITPSGADRRPLYLIALGWFPGFSYSDAEAVFPLTAPVPSTKNKRSADETLEATVFDWVVTYLCGVVAPSAQAVPYAFRVLVAHAFKYNDDARVKEFKHCSEETQASYAAELGKLVLFAMRYCALPGVKMLHQWRPTAKPGLVDYLARLKLLAADPDNSLSTDAKKLEVQLLVCDILLCLFSEASTPDPERLEPPVHAALKASCRACLLVTFVCCSLVVRGDLPNKFAYADAQRCRKLCGPLIYYVKAIVLHRLGSRPNLPAPDLPIAGLLLEQLVSPGDPAGSALLELVRNPVVPFKVLVSTATTSRHHAEREASQPRTFEQLPPEYHGYTFDDKVVFVELLHEGGLRALQKLDESMATLGIYCYPNAAAATSGGVPLAPLYLGAISFQDSHDYEKRIEFRGVDEEHNTDFLANKLNYMNQRAPIHGLLGQVSLLLRMFLVAIYADTKQGARVSEYLSLQALPTGGLARLVSIDALGCVQLHVSSRKNNLSDIITLSPELSKRAILILALVRPTVFVLLKDRLSEQERNCLLPGVNADTARRDITKLFTDVNVECGRLRSSRGLVAISPAALQGITPSVLRQFVHMFIISLAPARFAAQPHLLTRMIENHSAGLAQRLEGNADFNLMCVTDLLPKMLGGLGLHSVRTASRIYGQSPQSLPLERQQTGAYREFIRYLAKYASDTVKDKLGSLPSDEDTNKTARSVPVEDDCSVVPMGEDTPSRKTLASSTVLEESPPKRSRLLQSDGGACGGGGGGGGSDGGGSDGGRDDGVAGSGFGSGAVVAGAGFANAAAGSTFLP